MPLPLTEHHDEQSLDMLIEKSAQRGARLALGELGLDDASASQDLKDLRQLLTSWRRVRRETVQIAIRLGVQVMLLGMLAMATIVLWASGK